MQQSIGKRHDNSLDANNYTLPVRRYEWPSLPCLQCSLSVRNGVGELLWLNGSTVFCTMKVSSEVQVIRAVDIADTHDLRFVSPQCLSLDKIDTYVEIKELIINEVPWLLNGEIIVDIEIEKKCLIQDLE